MGLTERQITEWLRQGLSPPRLAFTLALGFAIGCIPLVGTTTVVCAALALAFRLNMPAIQAANYAAMPLQLILIVPFVRLGRWVFAFGPQQASAAEKLLHASPWEVVSQFGWLTAQAMFGWALTAAPAMALMTLGLNLMLHRVPKRAAIESAE
jgi:uncharacterized protein (DUF2062 family)